MRLTWRPVIISAMRILLTGVSGFVGAALAPRLLEQGHELRGLARDRERVREALAFSGAVTLDDMDLRIGDTLSGEGVAAAMRGIDVAYYLVHSMEPTVTGADGPFPARELASADTFARAARAATVERIVYLGGPLPSGGRPSSHLLSRHAVERTLLDAVPDSVALRASIVIGARSRSFRFLVRLVERMPVLTLPAWRDYRTQPIDERDVVAMLAACATNDDLARRTLDVGGPDVLSYGDMIRRIASLMMLARPAVGLGFSATPLAARLAASLTREQPEFITPLMEGLTGDLLVADDAAGILNVQLHRFDAAVEHALHEWERVEPLAAR